MTGVKTPERYREHKPDTLKIKQHSGLSAPGASRLPRGYFWQDERAEQDSCLCDNTVLLYRRDTAGDGDDPAR